MSVTWLREHFWAGLLNVFPSIFQSTANYKQCWRCVVKSIILDGEDQGAWMQLSSVSYSCVEWFPSSWDSASLLKKSKCDHQLPCQFHKDQSVRWLCGWQHFNFFTRSLRYHDETEQHIYVHIIINAASNTHWFWIKVVTVNEGRRISFENSQQKAYLVLL